MEPRITFFTDARMSQFWEYVKMLLLTISPGVMITVAIAAAGIFLTIVVKAWVSATKEVE